MNRTIFLLAIIAAFQLAQAIPTSQDDYGAKNQGGYEYEDARKQDDDYQELEALLKGVMAKEQSDYEHAGAKKQYDYEDAKKQDDDDYSLEFEALLKDALAKEEAYDYVNAKARARKQADYEELAREEDDGDYPELHEILKDVLAKEQDDYAREQDDYAREQDDYAREQEDDYAREQEDDYPEVQYKDYENAQAKEQMAMLKDALQELAKSESDDVTVQRSNHCYYFTRSTARHLYNLLRRAYYYMIRRRG